MNGRGGVKVCWGGGKSWWEACAGRGWGAGGVRVCVVSVVACVGRVWGAKSVGIARSALLSGYLCKSGHLLSMEKQQKKIQKARVLGF